MYIKTQCILHSLTQFFLQAVSGAFQEQLMVVQRYGDSHPLKSTRIFLLHRLMWLEYRGSHSCPSTDPLVDFTMK